MLHIGPGSQAKVEDATDDAIIIPISTANENAEVTLDASHLIQYVPKYEDLTIADFKEYDTKTFAQFEKEVDMDVK